MATPTTTISTGPKALPVLASLDNVAELTGKFFDRNYYNLEFPSGSGNFYIMPGLIIALNTATNKYVPWVTDARYGAGSDTAVGVNVAIVELSNFDRVISPVYHGEFVEKYCHTVDDTMGTIPASVKTNLADIKWK